VSRLNSNPDARSDEGGFREVERALLYQVSEAAALLGIGRTNVYYLMNDGKLGSVRIGSRRLIPRAALLAFVEGLAEAS